MKGKVEGAQQICNIGKRMSKSGHFPAGDERIQRQYRGLYGEPHILEYTNNSRLVLVED